MNRGHSWERGLILGIFIAFVLTACMVDSGEDLARDPADDDATENDATIGEGDPQEDTTQDLDDNLSWDFRVSGYLQQNPKTAGMVDMFLPGIVDVWGEIWDPMEIEGVRIYEDGIEREYKKEPVSEENKAKMDLMVVLDSTDSMDGEITSVKTSIGTFLDSLSAYDKRIGGVSYHDWVGVASPNYVEQAAACDDTYTTSASFGANGAAYLQPFYSALPGATLTGFRYKLGNSTNMYYPIRIVVVTKTVMSGGLPFPSGAPVYRSPEITAHYDVPVGDWVEVDLSDVPELQANPLEGTMIWVGVEWVSLNGPKILLDTVSTLPGCPVDMIRYTYTPATGGTYGNSSYNGAWHWQVTLKHKNVLAYDDGTPDQHRTFTAGGRYVQGFTPPFYPAVITGFRYMLANNTYDTDPIRIVVNYDNTTTTTPPYVDVYYSGNKDLSGTALTWIDVDLSDVAALKNNPITTGQFWIGFEWQTEQHGPDLSFDSARLPPYNVDDLWYSYSYQNYYVNSAYNGTWMIRPIIARPSVSAANASKNDLSFINLNSSRTPFNTWLAAIETGGGAVQLAEGTLTAVAEAWLKAGWRTGAALERYLVITDAPMHEMYDGQYDSKHSVTWLLNDVCDMFDSTSSIGWLPVGTGRDGYAWVVSANSRDADGDGVQEYWDNEYGRYWEDDYQGTGTYKHRDPKSLATCAGEWINLGSGSFSITADRIYKELAKGTFFTFESGDPEAVHDVTIQIELANGEYAEHTWRNVRYARAASAPTEEVVGP